MMYNMECAPKDGSLIILVRKSGLEIPGYWGSRQSIFRSGSQWLSQEDKFIDVPFDKVIGWKIIKEK